MKTCIKTSPFLRVVLFACGSMLAGQAGRVAGQTFTTLYSFTAGDPILEAPGAGLAISGNRLYGTTQGNGSSSWGTVFAINTDGTGFTNLYSFSGGSDGANPYGVIISGSVLYGTTDGGPNGGDTIFQLNTDGTGFSTLYVFNADSDGSYPGGLILSGSTLFGFTQFRGPGANGTVFAVNSDGTAFTTLYSFTGGGDGSRPLGTLSLAGGVLYGATVWGGVDGIPPGGPGANGTLFALNADGTGFTVLRSFTNTATDGGAPNGLILFGNTLYGTACCGSLGAWNGVRR